MITRTRSVRAPRGPSRSCKGWPQETALRMLMNNLDPDIAEQPDNLVVYGGSGKAARNWDAFDAIVRSLRNLDHDETLIVQSGKPVDPQQYITHSMASMACHVDAMLAFRTRGAVVFDYGNNIRAQARDAGVKNAFDIPGFVPEYVRPLFCEGRGPFRWVALSGDPDDIRVTDTAALDMFSENDALCRWNHGGGRGDRVFAARRHGRRRRRFAGRRREARARVDVRPGPWRGATCRRQISRGNRNRGIAWRTAPNARARHAYALASIYGWMRRTMR